jgi:hypothetical protein
MPTKTQPTARKTTQRAIRLTPLTVTQASELAKLWGPIKPLSLADVVAECIGRVHQKEAKHKETRT